MGPAACQELKHISYYGFNYRNTCNIEVADLFTFFLARFVSSVHPYALRWEGCVCGSMYLRMCTPKCIRAKYFRVASSDGVCCSIYGSSVSCLGDHWQNSSNNYSTILCYQERAATDPVTSVRHFSAKHPQDLKRFLFPSPVLLLHLLFNKLKSHCLSSKKIFHFCI